MCPLGPRPSDLLLKDLMVFLMLTQGKNLKKAVAVEFCIAHLKPLWTRAGSNLPGIAERVIRVCLGDAVLANHGDDCDAHVDARKVDVQDPEEAHHGQGVSRAELPYQGHFFGHQNF